MAVIKYFNPSQVQFTLEYKIDDLLKIIRFQSLTGSIHTCPGIRLYMCRVSIPHRFNSHVDKLLS